ncbi:hypothetical protein B9X73_10670 [Acinetobacter baumannii]|nr:hypothetical protein RP89_03955 [Acinetobacter baumannii]KRI86166.1 hypothetical protein APC69_10070 [Acinetobacter baumannii]KRI93097.1 hypothetical protein APC70_15630 [Acinetobacter baumannii]OOS43123.1 hypothetical protein BTG55_00320 [Acinetobacter baumannii]OTK36243.1 hypothetical protein B9X74_12300 [Acinetobacter baumannii]
MDTPNLSHFLKTLFQLEFFYPAIYYENCLLNILIANKPDILVINGLNFFNYDPFLRKALKSHKYNLIKSE